MKTVFIVAVLVGILAMFMISNQSFAIVNGINFSNIDKDYWLCYGQNATISEGYARLTVNDTVESPLHPWTYSKVQQGIMPHGWTQKDTLAKEIKVDTTFEANENVMFIRCIANRSEFQYYNETHSQVNFMVSLWFQLDDDYDKDVDESTQLVLDIRLMPTKYIEGETFIMYEDIYFEGSHVDNDYHYLVCVDKPMLENNKFYDITIDVGSLISRAFNYFKIKKATLRCVEPNIEAHYGYGQVYIDFFEFKFEPKITSKYTFIFGAMFGVVAIIIVILVQVFKEWI